jgi:hypothetical protein
VNMTHGDWFMQKQEPVEMAAHGSEFVGARTAAAEQVC